MPISTRRSTRNTSVVVAAEPSPKTSKKSKGTSKSSATTKKDTKNGKSTNNNNNKNNDKKVESPKAKPATIIKETFENLTNVLTEFKNTNSEYDHFFIANSKQCERYKNMTKHLYDHLQKRRELFDTKVQTKLKKDEIIKSLMTKGFDTEQVWQQMKMFNEPFLKCIVKDVASFTDKKTIIALNVETGEKKSSKLSDKTEKLNRKKVDFDDDSDDLEELEDDDELDDVEERKITNSKNAKSDVPKEKVDFFDFKEMEAFLDAEDEKAMRQDTDQPAGEDDDEDNVDIDYFADIPSDDDDEGGEDEENEEMYQDFFDPPKKKESKNKKVGFNADEDDDDDDESDEEEDEEIDGLDTRDFDDDQTPLADDEEILGSEIFESGESSDDEEETEQSKINRRLKALAAENYGDGSDDDLEGKSEFEKSQLLLKRRIEKAQRELLQPAALNWKLAGESAAAARPENALLEEHLDFDHISRPAPVITDDTTKTLEDLIRQRIKDKAFDDVERKFKPKEEPFEFRKRLLLDSEKSKAGLAEVYEQEFLKKQQDAQEQQNSAGGFVAAGEAEETETRKTIRRMMRSLFRKLDALSSFHFTPRAPEAEVKIINNLPAVSIEEATPDMGSTKSLIAPEEVFSTRTKKVLQAPGERDSTDKKRARRIKKKKQGVRRALDERKQGTTASMVNKAEIEKLKSKAASTGLKKTFSSSSKFFERLQESKDSQHTEKRKKKTIEANLAKKLKLN